MKKLHYFTCAVFLLGNLTGVHASVLSTTKVPFKLEPLDFSDDFLEAQQNRVPGLTDEPSNLNPITTNFSLKNGTKDKKKGSSKANKQAAWRELRGKLSEEHKKERAIRNKIRECSENGEDLLTFFDEKFPNLSLQMAARAFITLPIKAIAPQNGPQVQTNGHSYRNYQIRTLNNVLYLLKSTPDKSRDKARNFIWSEAKAGFCIRFSFYQQVFNKLSQKETLEQIVTDLEFYNHVSCPFVLFAKKQESEYAQNYSLALCVASRFLKNGHALSEEIFQKFTNANTSNRIFDTDPKVILKLLDTMHENDVVHNDLHAGNIIVPECVLIDFNQVQFGVQNLSKKNLERRKLEKTLDRYIELEDCRLSGKTSECSPDDIIPDDLLLQM